MRQNFLIVDRQPLEIAMQDSTLQNVRLRGKISRDQWPKIAERFNNGETLTEIARSYQCTAPAIRYIVGRVSRLPEKRNIERDKPEGAVAPVSGMNGPGTASVFSAGGGGNQAGRHSPGSSTAQIWDRISSDIASFLAGMDVLSVNDSDENYQALLAATDRLLLASARTRMELERVLGSRKKTARQR